MVQIGDYKFINGRAYKDIPESNDTLVDVSKAPWIRRAIRPQPHNMILKFATNLEPFSEPFILKDSFCIGTCDGCKYNGSCGRVVEVRESRLWCVTADISSQEPMIASFVHKVPEWLKVFRNLKLRKYNLTFFLDLLANEIFFIDVESDHSYWAWLATIENDRNKYIKLAKDCEIMKSKEVSDSTIADIYSYWATDLDNFLSKSNN